MKKIDRRAEYKQRAVKFYNKTITDIRKVILKEREPLDSILLLRSVLPIKETTKAHHFNGGVIYINEEMLARLEPMGQLQILTKHALNCAAWMEKRVPKDVR